MRDSLLVRFAAFVLLLLLWTVFAAAPWAEDAAAPTSQQQSAPGDGIAGTPPAAAQPAPAAQAAAPPPAAAAPASIEDCIDDNGDFTTTGKRYGFVVTLANKCEKRLKCVIDAYVTGAKGPSSGHGTVILAPKSQGEAATKSFAMKVKLPGGTAQISRTCKAF